MRILIATVFLIATTVFLSICPSLPSALASTLDTSVLLLAQTQPIPTTSSTDASTTSAPSSTDSSLTSPTLSSSDFSFTSSDFDKLVRPQTSAQNVNWSNLVLLVTAIVSSSLLMAMVLWVSLGQSNSPVKDGTQSTPNIDGLEQKGDFIVKSFPTVIEGITVYLIVAVVAVLSLSATIQPEGTISIISGISGYVLGRQVQKEVKAKVISFRERSWFQGRGDRSLGNWKGRSLIALQYNVITPRLGSSLNWMIDSLRDRKISSI